MKKRDPCELSSVCVGGQPQFVFILFFLSWPCLKVSKGSETASQGWQSSYLKLRENLSLPGRNEKRGPCGLKQVRGILSFLFSFLSLLYPEGEICHVELCDSKGNKMLCEKPVYLARGTGKGAAGNQRLGRISQQGGSQRKDLLILCSN